MLSYSWYFFILNFYCMHSYTRTLILYNFIAKCLYVWEYQPFNVVHSP